MFSAFHPHSDRERHSVFIGSVPIGGAHDSAPGQINWTGRVERKAKSQVAIFIAFDGSISVGAMVRSHSSQSVLIGHKEPIMRLIPILAAVTIGLFATAATAQNRDPGSAPPGVSTTGGKPLPVDPAEVRRDNTAGPGVAPGAKRDGGKPLPVDPNEVKRENAIPGGK
jgi:hypothetical protein